MNTVSPYFDIDFPLQTPDVYKHKNNMCSEWSECFSNWKHEHVTSKKIISITLKVNQLALNFY